MATVGTFLTVPNVVCFVLMCMVSCSLNGFIQSLHDKPLERLRPRFGGGKSFDDLKRACKDDLHLSLGAEIGSLERVIFIYAVMVEKYELIAGWLVLKAFFGWIGKAGFVSRINVGCVDGGEAKMLKREVELVSYYLYVYGNGLSIAAGLILGHIAILLSKTIS